MPFPRCVQLAGALISLICGSALANPAGVPGSGSLLQEAQPSKPPEAAAADPGLVIPQEKAPALPASSPIAISRIVVRGQQSFSAETLHALVADAEGKALTLAELGELAARLTDFYHRQGFPLARAIIPAQRMENAELYIEVIEARYGKVSIDNQSRVDDALLDATVAPLQPGQPIEQGALERRLLLLGDIPGVSSEALLKPGAEVGQADLQISATPTAGVVGQLGIDNYGSSEIGRERLGGTVGFIDLLQHGDVLSLNLLTTARHMKYGRVAYDTLVNGEGTRVGGAYSLLAYSLGQKYATLDAHGTAAVASLWARHPLLRSRDSNLYLQAQADHLDLKDHIDLAELKTDRHLDDTALNLTGDWRDGLFGGGRTAWTLGWTAGRVAFDDASAALSDATTAQTQGGYNRWNFAFSRQQTLGANTALNLRGAGQWASGNLDSSQKMIVGGPYSVRAYDTGAVSADIGVTASVELQHDLGMFWNSQWQAVVFIDSAHLTINADPWSSDSNRQTLSGAGFGLNWSIADGWRARAYVASRIGPRPELVEDTSRTRAWLEVTRSF